MGTTLKLPAESNRRAQILFNYDGEIIFQPKPGEDVDALYERIYKAYEDRSKIEQDEKGMFTHVMAPTGGESGTQNVDLNGLKRRCGSIFVAALTLAG